MSRYIGALALALFLFAAREGSAAQLKGNFCLIDTATQVPVLGATVPKGWAAGGKTTWTQEPNDPVHWYIWCMSPDGSARMAVSSPFSLAFPGLFQQVPVLQAQNLAGMLLESAAKDYALTNVRISEASFKDTSNTPQGRTILQRYPSPGSRVGAMTVGSVAIAEFSARYEGNRGGKPYSVLVGMPVFAIEYRAAVNTTMVQLMTSISCGFARGRDGAAQKQLDAFVKSLSLNPGFTNLVNQIIDNRTQSWLQTQREIREIQMGVYRDAGSTQDRIRSRWSEYIRDVDVVTDPASGQQVALDARYDHARIGSDGTIIYYNDGFNPNTNTATFDPNTNPYFNNISWGQDLRRR